MDPLAFQFHARFTFYEKERLLTNSRRVGNGVHTNYDLTFTCDECRHKEIEQVEDWEAIETPTDGEVE